ncbi:DUF4825 domain-containing protein [Heliorestis acidaminivorans]|uniref:DUF4825 domain-containing protein n=1 Tax=Heliorestis acidaminivorans TaxID=553427 RepID=A0A6I0ESF7_9FIRM|nr:DUF4825 domain-containing protein [Heliorestis acidaminivorans]KAB2953440.1 DUF4825 domain-containing protein [Heliorestis acidaminivorans]
MKKEKEKEIETERQTLQKGQAKTKITLLTVLVTLMAFLLVACGIHQEQNDHQGTLEYEKIYQQKTSYIGDASKVGNLTNLLHYSEYKKGIALQTAQEPYGVTVNYNMPEEFLQQGTVTMTDKMFQNGALIFCLIDNVDVATFVFDNGQETESFSFAREDFDIFFEKDIRTYGSSWEVFSNDFVALLEQEG